MSEREFNRKILKEKLSEFTYSETFLDKILDLTSESYIEGLKQGMFDRKMLEAENEILKEQLKDENNYSKEADKWYKEAFNLVQENNQLKHRIKKAIEYIDNEAYTDYERELAHDLYDTQIFKLIRILKGEKDV